MEKVNFRESVFRGNLRDLLEQGRPELRDSGKTFRVAHEWLRLQLHQEDNILPVRKFAQYSARGSLHRFGDNSSSFMPTDNEPLAHLYQRWTQLERIDCAIGRALTEGKVVASWRCDQVPQPVPTMRFKGVKTAFRDRGLKLAHISDAARGVSPDLQLHEQIAIRFLRTLSPFNVFLFPSCRCCEFRLISSRTDWKPITLDWAEDPELRRMALAWLVDRMGETVVDALPDFESQIEPISGWMRMAEGTIVEVFPKTKAALIKVHPKSLVNSAHRRNPRLIQSERSEKPSPDSCPKISKKEAVTVSEAVDILRKWRRSFPLAIRLDGRSGENSKEGGGNERWFHIRVDGYGEGDSFKSHHDGSEFCGQDYNGIVNFHADAKTVAVDHFIELLDEAENYHDVLRPSATYETAERLPKNARPRPKFALQGHGDEVEGFYLYHDEWRDTRS